MSTVKIRFLPFSVRGTHVNLRNCTNTCFGSNPRETEWPSSGIEKEGACGDTKAHSTRNCSNSEREWPGTSMKPPIGIASPRIEVILSLRQSAYLYEKRQDGVRDLSEAARWYMRAAVSGFARAEFNLERCIFREAE